MSLVKFGKTSLLPPTRIPTQDDRRHPKPMWRRRPAAYTCGPLSVRLRKKDRKPMWLVQFSKFTVLYGREWLRIRCCPAPSAFPQPTMWVSWGAHTHPPSSSRYAAGSPTDRSRPIPLTYCDSLLFGSNLGSDQIGAVLSGHVFGSSRLIADHG